MNCNWVYGNFVWEGKRLPLDISRTVKEDLKFSGWEAKFNTDIMRFNLFYKF